MRGASLSFAVTLAVLVACACAASPGPGDHKTTDHVVKNPRVPEVTNGAMQYAGADTSRHQHAGSQASASSNQQVSFKALAPKAPVSKRQRTPMPHQTTGGRQSRFLSLFSVVRFENLECGAVSGDSGTCLASAECLERGGVSSGPCAGGFGVCCVFILTCGHQTSQNTTYFVNSGYPEPYDGTGSCQLTVHKRHPDICQLRLDFDQFKISGPEEVNHVCNNDQFIVSGGSPVPVICGTSTGNHMYINVGAGNSNPVTLTFVTSGASLPRNWKVRISQIPCSSNYKAEDGCMQYHTGVTGQLRSFNYDSDMGLQLSNQDYSICIRMERNFCGIHYTADDTTVSSHSFSLSGDTMGTKQANSMINPDSCNGDWLIIPCAANIDANNQQPTCIDRICGGTFNAMENKNTPATVFSTVKPFRLIFHTDSVESAGDSADKGNRGFALNYKQQPCTNVHN